MAFAPRRPLPVLARKRRALSSAKNEEKVVLDRVLGLTCANNNSLAVSSTSHCIAYPAGCTVVLFYPKKNKQKHIINPSRKPISCLCLGSEKYLAYGECGHSPAIRIWDTSCDPPLEIVKLNGHAFGVTCLAFSTNLRYLVSVGYQHDQNVFVWNWKSNAILATNKITTKVSGISFSEDGKYFVTVGNRRVRYWYFDTTTKDSKINSKSTLPLTGRSAILGNQQNRKFLAVTCGRGSFAKFTYVITACGLLFQFNEEREIDKMLDVQSGRGYCICTTASHVVVGCGDGVIRLFDPLSLDYTVSLPRPHCLGVELSTCNDFMSEKGKTPDTVAMAFDFQSNKLVVVYNDHSLYTWDLKSLSQIGKAYSCLFHNACIWDISVYSPATNRLLLPVNTFITCASDNTIRFWSIDGGNQGELCFKNIFSKELIRIIYDNEDTNCLKDASQLPGDCSAVSDITRGTRCVEVHPLGHQIASGDRQGNLKIYDLNFMDKVDNIMAHDAEILSIAYSMPKENNTLWFATASRDRLIHLFDVARGYSHAHTICDHSAAITSVKFIVNVDSVHLVSCGADKSLVIQEIVEAPPTQDSRGTAPGRPSVKRVNHIVEKSTMYDMIVDPTLKTLSTVGQDRLVKVYNASSCKLKTTYKGGASDESSVLLRVAMDPSGLLIATSSSDKMVCVFEFSSGECIAKLHGHSEVVTALRFSGCCRYLYTVSGDSCIFVWKLSPDLVQRMYSRLTEIGLEDQIHCHRNNDRYEARKRTYCISSDSRNKDGVTSISSDIPANSDTVNSEDTDTHITEDDITGAQFKFSLNQLPSWAQNQVISRPSVAASVGLDIQQDKVPVIESHVSHVTGKWAERVDETTSMLTAADVDTFSDSEILDEEPNQSMLNFETKMSLEDLRIEIEDIIPDDPDEIVYPVCHGRESVDASMFKVRTPEKRPSVGIDDTVVMTLYEENKENVPDNEDIVSDNEEEEEDTTQQLPQEGETFLKKTFESLSADELFEREDLEAELVELSPRRPSISTMYFKKSRSRLVQNTTTGTVQPPPIPLDVTTPPSITLDATTPTSIPSAPVTQVDTNTTAEDPLNLTTPTTHQLTTPTTHQSLPVSIIEPTVIIKDSEIATPSDNESTNDNSDVGLHSRPRPLPSDKKNSRSKITLEEINKARKRLEELGYSKEYIHGAGKSKGVEESEALSEDVINHDEQNTTDNTTIPVGLVSDVGGVKGGVSPPEEDLVDGSGLEEEGDSRGEEVLEQLRTVASDLGVLVSNIEQSTPTMSLLSSYATTMADIKQSVARWEEVLNEKSRDPLVADTSLHYAQSVTTIPPSPTQPYLSSEGLREPPLIPERNSDERIVSSSVMDECSLNRTLSGEIKGPGMLLEPNTVVEGSSNQVVNAVTLDPVLIKPLIEEYSQQLVEAVKLHLSSIK